MINSDKYAYSVLFIEDEDIVRKNYILYLGMIFDRVYEAADGLEAYRIYKEHRPDILIVDINLPKLNGIELIEMIREHDSVAKIIVLTAHNDKDFSHEVARFKLSDYLVKPITRKALQQSLDKTMDEIKSLATTP